MVVQYFGIFKKKKIIERFKSKILGERFSLMTVQKKKEDKLSALQGNLVLGLVVAVLAGEAVPAVLGVHVHPQKVPGKTHKASVN